MKLFYPFRLSLLARRVEPDYVEHVHISRRRSSRKTSPYQHVTMTTFRRHQYENIGWSCRRDTRRPVSRSPLFLFRRSAVSVVRAPLSYFASLLIIARAFPNGFCTFSNVEKVSSFRRPESLLMFVAVR